MSSTTRVKTSSGQTIITRNNSSSDRPATYCIRSSVRIKKNKRKKKIYISFFSRFHLLMMLMKHLVNISKTYLSFSYHFCFSK
jgi:hypothetical protein